MVTFSVLRSWSPSARVSSIENGVWAAAASLSEAAWKVGANGLGELGQGAPKGPESRVKNWVALWVGRDSSQGTKVLWTA